MPDEAKGNFVHLAYGKYDDIRMPWVGKYGGDPESFSVSDATAAVKIARINPNRVCLIITNDGANTAYLGLGQDAVANSLLRLNQGGSTMIFDRLMPWADYITAVCATGLTTALLVADISQGLIDSNGRGD